MKKLTQVLLCSLLLGLAACAPENENSGGKSKQKTIFDEEVVDIQALSTPDSVYGLFEGQSQISGSATIYSRIKITDDGEYYQAAHCEFFDGTSVFAQVVVDLDVDEVNETIEVLADASKTATRKKDGSEYSCTVMVQATSPISYSVNSGSMTVGFRSYTKLNDLD
ncbi:MAG: hypothetical protein HRT45_15605 [Bdellovibrionales bacterium]|nr:hypothetical protein [Bdellovibrionales bacterium]